MSKRRRKKRASKDWLNQKKRSYNSTLMREFHGSATIKSNEAWKNAMFPGILRISWERSEALKRIHELNVPLERRTLMRDKVDEKVWMFTDFERYWFVRIQYTKGPVKIDHSIFYRNRDRAMDVWKYQQMSWAEDLRGIDGCSPDVPVAASKSLSLPTVAPKR